MPPTPPLNVQSGPWWAAVPPGPVGYDINADELLLHSFQSAAAFETLQREGVLRGDERFADPAYIPAYRWLARQFAGQACGGDAVDVPLWAWARTRRRHLVAEALHDARRVPGAVLLTLRVARARVLVSSYMDWHAVLNGGPLWLPNAESEAELDDHFDAWDARWGPDWRRRLARGDRDLLSALEETWGGIFELAGRRDAYPLQACVEEFRSRDVVRAFVIEPAARPQPGSWRGARHHVRAANGQAQRHL